MQLLWRQTLNVNRWDGSDVELAALEDLGVVNWAPGGKDDDLYTIQLAQDTEAFVIGNDAWREYGRWVNASLRRRQVRFWFAGSGAHRELFGVAPDDLLRLQQSGR